MAATWRAAQEGSERPLAEADVARALRRLDPLWDELFPAEQRRIVRLLVERIDVLPDALRLRLRAAGLLSLVEDLRSGEDEPVRSAA